MVLAVALDGVTSQGFFAADIILYNGQKDNSPLLILAIIRGASLQNLGSRRNTTADGFLWSTSAACRIKNSAPGCARPRIPTSRGAHFATICVHAGAARPVQAVTVQ